MRYRSAAESSPQCHNKTDMPHQQVLQPYPTRLQIFIRLAALALATIVLGAAAVVAAHHDSIVTATIYTALIAYLFVIHHHEFRHLLRRQAKPAEQLPEPDPESITPVTHIVTPLIRPEPIDQQVADLKLAEIGQLASGFAHHIRNPLNAVTNLAESTAGAAQDLETQVQHAQSMMSADQMDEILDLTSAIKDASNRTMNNALRADRVVQAMLALQRDSTRVTRPTDVSAIISQQVAVLQETPPEHLRGATITFSTAFAPELPSAPAIPEDLAQAIHNVLLNAAEAAVEKSDLNPQHQPTVTVTAVLDNNHIAVAITDNGYGISPDNLPNIFTPFFSTRPAQHNIGMGLAITLDIMRAHQGTIHAYSTPGISTTVTMEFPTPATCESHPSDSEDTR